MRYTEVRLTQLAEEMLGDDIDKETVDWVPNYDGSLERAAGPARASSRTCWSTAPPASRSAWRPTSRRTTSREVIDAHRSLLIDNPDVDRSTS